MDGYLILLKFIRASEGDSNRICRNFIIRVISAEHFKDEFFGASL